MIRAITLALAAVCAAPASAQVFPMPGHDSPRIQTVAWQPGEPIVLTALPETALTVMLEPGETIERAVLGGNRLWEVTVSAESDSFQVKPLVNAAPATLSVQTDARQYEFALETGQNLQAAYLVRLDFGAPAETAQAVSVEEIEDLSWSYRLRGDRSVRPASIRDNGRKTVIEYAPGQPLPAVFAIGATGDEEVVDGYMRGGKFVIDRVHQRLVFRIDKQKATARRNAHADGAT
ncbi:TrbG/VirB9 family P-type conjugative transfer protein [Erythrobacter sp. JK5]|uniref:TrbG/VirB9 family P-type conjugative transfer protein n=1 Tax=Erythrobacter sp. JK5 TaxID=2829500 RepID=UPI001BA5A612|nr:TrbG/VirB9 family P-type conjugative transfer protein [Erythrobacter sp. JK5]QUL36887.1 TrbG/VirB9 family P-type conjugative transfer protein [Erythrobacter sp. JK5]